MTSWCPATSIPTAWLAFGQMPSLLDLSKPGLGVDHLDSFVRAGWVHRWLTTSAVELLRSMRVRQGRLDAPIEAGLQLALLMRNNASFHVHPANVGPVGMVRRLVRRLTGAAGPSVSDLSRQGDHELWKCLLDDDVTGTETRRLLDHPEDLAVAAVQHDEPPDLLELVRIPKMYLSQPTAASDAGINALLDGANRLPRRFAVGWREDMDQWAAAAGHRR